MWARAAFFKGLGGLWSMASLVAPELGEGVGDSLLGSTVTETRRFCCVFSSGD
jgi:hypothetical protein